MGTEQITGQLLTLGPSRVQKNGVAYSYIEIGEKRLKDIFVPDGLKGFLDKSLGEAAPITLWIFSFWFVSWNRTIAITSSKGEIIKTKGGFGKLLGGIFLGLISLPFLLNLFDYSHFDAMNFAGLSWGLCLGFLAYVQLSVGWAMTSIQANDTI